MAYEREEVRLSQEIFYYLLEHHELREEEARELYRAYTESEPVQEMVKAQGRIAASRVKRYGDAVYLIPEPDNDFLGYTRAHLKKELCRSNATDKDYYLAQFAILVLLLEFYDGQGASSKTRDYIRVGELQNSISERLREGAELAAEEQEAQGLAYQDMLEAYESLRSDDRGTRQRTTKEGFLYRILRFLQAQGLIEYVEQDEMIKTRRKLDRFMAWNLLNENNHSRVLKVLGVEDDEQDPRGAADQYQLQPCRDPNQRRNDALQRREHADLPAERRRQVRPRADALCALRAEALPQCEGQAVRRLFPHAAAVLHPRRMAAGAGRRLPADGHDGAPQPGCRRGRGA